MRKLLHTLLLFVVSTIFGKSINGQPTGIYVLDNSNGTYRDANIRNYSFVDGFVWRTSWSEIETAPGIYNYAGIDHIVKKLDSINQKLTILFGAYAIEPSYIALQTGVSTYSFLNPTNNVSSIRAVPYDGYLLNRFRLFLSSLANHQVHRLSTGTMVALKDHPVLANIATNIPGLGAIRNVNGLNTSIETVLPGYTRTKFVDSLAASMKIQTDNFPSKNVFIPSYKNINDNTPFPSLQAVIRTQLLLTFNNIQHPKISFWQENLAGFRDATTNVFTGLPTTVFATPLVQLNDSAYTMFQMLQGWTTPFLDPSKTANSTPFDAMCYAYGTYGASYYELYVSDIDNPIYQASFNAWNPITSCGTVVPVTITNLTAKRNNDKSISINWNVATEVDVAQYYVERSADGSNFSTIGTTMPAANNAGAAAYHINDLMPLGTDNFYRVKALSLNGRLQYSSIVKVSAKNSSPIVLVYPNPVVNKCIQMRFSNQQTGNYDIQLINQFGQQIYVKSEQIASTDVMKSIQLDRSFAMGVYLLTITSPDKSKMVQQVIIQ
jgi:hypothetical protein